MDDPKFDRPAEGDEPDWYTSRGFDLERIRQAVARGIADADAGRVVDLDEAFDELEAEIEGLINRE